jgi:hypothetical protein
LHPAGPSPRGALRTGCGQSHRGGLHPHTTRCRDPPHGPQAATRGLRLELLRQSCLLQYAVGGVSRQLLIQHGEAGISPLRWTPMVRCATCDANPSWQWFGAARRREDEPGARAGAARTARTPLTALTAHWHRSAMLTQRRRAVARIERSAMPCRTGAAQNQSTPARTH